MSATPSSSGVGRCGSVAGGAPESATPPSPSRETRTPVRPISAVSVAWGTGEGEAMGRVPAILGGPSVLVKQWVAPIRLALVHACENNYSAGPGGPAGSLKFTRCGGNTHTELQSAKEPR